MRRRLQQSVVAVFLAVACGANDPGIGASGGGDGASAASGGGAPGAVMMGAGGSVNHSGSRLKVRSIRSDDGAQLVLGFFDTKFGVPCAPGRTSDNVLRCLPSVPRLAPAPATLNADCSSLQSVLTASDIAKLNPCDKGGARRLFNIGLNAETCDGTKPAQYWLATAEPQATYWPNQYSTAHECLGPAQQYIVSPVPDSDFVALTEATE